MSIAKKTAFTLTALMICSASYGSFGGAVSPYAYELFTLPGLNFTITNSMLTTWAISIALIVIVKLAVGNASLVPSRGQAVVESMIVAVRDTIEPVVGKKMVGPVFPLLISFFIFILINNWSGLLPGAGTFGVMHTDAHGHEHLNYFFRPANADLNTTMALAVVSFIAWLFFIFKYAGPKVILHDLFGNKATKGEVPGAMYAALTVIFFAVGGIEIISILFRPISLSFRLFGNVFGGENLLSNMHGLLAYLLPVPFYLLEVLIGLIQAFVFTLLVAVYIGLICNHEGGEHDH